MEFMSTSKKYNTGGPIETAISAQNRAVFDAILLKNQLVNRLFPLNLIGFERPIRQRQRSETHRWAAVFGLITPILVSA